MKKIIISAFLLASLSAPAFAAKKQPNISGVQVQDLISRIEKKIEARKQKVSKLDTKIVRFFLSPSQPKQNENVVVFARIASRFLDSDTFLEATFDGNAVALEKSAAELWAYDAGKFSEIKSHSFAANVYIQDSVAAGEIKSGIAALDAAILSLNQQIDEETDETTRNQLIAERDTKLSQRMNLIDALNGLKKAIASETLTFSIAENPSAPGFPSIQSVSPKSGPVEGGTFVTITGENFSPGMTASLGDSSLTLNFVSPAQMNFITPQFSGEGPKDLEIRTVGPGIRNSIRKSAFFAVAHLPPVGNQKPVALAGASQSTSVGTQVSLNGSGSYDNNPGTSLTFAWKAISVPAGAGISTGVVYSTAPSFNFTPLKPGAYVWELTVNDGLLNSDASLTVVTANPPANSAPAPTAAAIVGLVNTTRTSQIAVNDADDYQAHSFRVVKQSPLGNASVSSTGLVTFTAANAAGSDAVEVAVFDNGTPPLLGVVTIPVTVQASTIAVDAIFAQVRARGDFITVAMGADVLTTTAPGVKKVVWNFGDGTSGASPYPFTDGFVEHDYLTAGTYTVTATLTDVYGNTGSKSYTFSTGSSNMPVPRLTSNVYSGPAPLTVNFDATSSTDDVGINQYRFRYGNGAPEVTNTTGLATYTYNNPGNYQVRLRTRDADNNISFAYLDIHVGTSPNAGKSRPMPLITGVREVAVGTPHAFSGALSYDPNPSGNITAYRWNFNDYYTCGSSHPTPGCTATGESQAYTYPIAYSFWPSLEVEGALGRTSIVNRQVLSVISGHAPRAMPGRLNAEGVAPFTLTVDGSDSFDYEGPVSAHSWNFGDGFCTSNCTLPTAIGSYTYNNPGNYFVNLEVTDSVGNKHAAGYSVIVYPSSKVKQKMERQVATVQAKTKANETDHEREKLKNFFAYSCAQGNAESCFEAGVMYEEDGNTFAAENFYAKACALGYSTACLVRKGE